ncbi:MAG: hypothetical protein GY855_04900 [candidate division Zixibacteria bacterium]|nr:hypothetical protein [candidate division Zixibacteria bacterium]
MSLKTSPFPQIPGSTSGKINLLYKIKNRFSPSDREVKSGLLEKLSKTDIDKAYLLLKYHESLLFIRAYPDNKDIFDIACRECNRIYNRVRLLNETDPDEAVKLEDSGISGTGMYYWYDYSTLYWLLKWYGDTLEINWDEYDNTEGCDNILPLISEWVENDGLDLADISTKEWIELRKGSSNKSSLRWFFGNIAKLKSLYLAKRNLYDSLELPVVWLLGNTTASRTNAVVPFEKPYFHQDGLMRKIKDFRREITKPIPEIKPAPEKTAKMMIKTVRSALAVRHRGLYPIEYASPDDVLIAECGRGYQLVMLGMEPEYRLPIESDYGALILKNGYVIGYGVGAMLFEQVEIAVNVFDTWRGSEAAFIFAQYVRAFHNQFKCTRFKIERYQVGYDNDEGLKSGSFWFYYKLGFVPEDIAVRKLAEKELKKINRNPKYRTSISTLKKLALSDMYYCLKGNPADLPPLPSLANIGMKTTEMIGKRFDGDGKKAVNICSSELAAILRRRGWRKRPRFEKEWFKRLSLIISQIPDLKKWSTEEKKLLYDIMCAKGKPGETEFVRLMIKHKKLRRAFLKIAN